VVGNNAAASIGVPLRSIGGTIDVEQGTLSLTDGAWTVDAGATLALAGGTHVLTGTISGSGEDVVRVSGGVSTSLAPAELALGDFTFELAGAATIAPDADLTVNAQGIWSAGTIGGAGRFVNAGSLAVTTNSPFLNTTLENLGLVRIVGTLRTSGEGDRPGRLLNQVGAELRLETGAIIRHHFDICIRRTSGTPYYDTHFGCGQCLLRAGRETGCMSAFALAQNCGGMSIGYLTRNARRQAFLVCRFRNGITNHVDPSPAVRRFLPRPRQQAGCLSFPSTFELTAIHRNTNPDMHPARPPRPPPRK
jgi:hypothetical protein